MPLCPIDIMKRFFIFIGALLAAPLEGVGFDLVVFCWNAACQHQWRLCAIWAIVACFCLACYGVTLLYGIAESREVGVSLKFLTTMRDMQIILVLIETLFFSLKVFIVDRDPFTRGVLACISTTPSVIAVYGVLFFLVCLRRYEQQRLSGQKPCISTSYK